LARRTGLSRNTVRAALRSDAPVFRCPERSSKLDPFKDEVHRLFKDDPRLTGVRVRELIEPLGFAGGKSIVDDYVREIRPLCNSAMATAVRPRFTPSTLVGSVTPAAAREFPSLGTDRRARVYTSRFDR
jgi:transposase